MILVGGENLIDFIQVEGSGGNPVYKANPGGSPYNCAKALGRQGESVGYLPPISSDSLGALLTRGLMEAGAELLSPRRDEPRSLAVVSLDGGAPSYQFYRDNTAERMVTVVSLEKSVPSEAKAFQLGSLSITGGDDADAWADFYVNMKGRGLFTSLDPNVRAAFIKDRETYLKRLELLLANTDLLKLSDEDLDWICPGEALPEAAAKLLQRSSAKLMVVTLGADGALALANDKTVKVPAAKVNDMKDTVGAGDTFMGTMLARLRSLDLLAGNRLGDLEETAVEALLKWASCAAALNCEQAGCNPPNFETLDAAYPIKTGDC